MQVALRGQPAKTAKVPLPIAFSAGVEKVIGKGRREPLPDA
jgi:hypothetical protein